MWHTVTLMFGNFFPGFQKETQSYSKLVSQKINSLLETPSVKKFLQSFFPLVDLTLSRFFLIL